MSTQHVFAARRGGNGICAFCPFPRGEGDHRELTESERVEAERLLRNVLDRWEF